ncbi:hypothetical protein [Thiobacillus sp.]|uniref:hypothetical protein n=1 Tax=Thiobacillus sp. TaxID=924 RepID=UPI0025E84D12|nr:hypothetical protein [Thiobacillus sp.]
MIEMFFAVTILLAVVAVVWLAAPWWLTVMVLAAGVLLLSRFLGAPPDAPGKEED